ncbi:hypothetical protein OTU49_001370, partial [Cherax quadricarinatus]
GVPGSLLAATTLCELTVGKVDVRAAVAPLVPLLLLLVTSQRVEHSQHLGHKETEAFPHSNIFLTICSSKLRALLFFSREYERCSKSCQFDLSEKSEVYVSLSEVHVYFIPRFMQQSVRVSGGSFHTRWMSLRCVPFLVPYNKVYGTGGCY